VDEGAILAGQADGAAAMLVDQADDLLVELSQDHLHDVHHLLVGHPHALAEFARYAHRLQQVADLRPAAVDDDRVHADELEHHHVAGKSGLEGGLRHRVATVLDDNSLVMKTLNVGQSLGQDLSLERGGGLGGHGGRDCSGGLGWRGF